jgi:hypothetical protein
VRHVVSTVGRVFWLWTIENGYVAALRIVLGAGRGRAASEGVGASNESSHGALQGAR